MICRYSSDQMHAYARAHAEQETAALRKRLSQFLAKECRRYIDDYPSLRHECEDKIARGERCKDCPINAAMDKPA